jgi:hypothetical protein
MDCGTYGSMISLASSSRFTGKMVVTLGLQRGDCGSLKGERMPKKFDKDDFTTRWKTVQDLCSVIACHSAFEDCMDDDGIGLGRHRVIVHLLSVITYNCRREQLATNSTEHLARGFLEGIDERVRPFGRLWGRVRNHRYVMDR